MAKIWPAIWKCKEENCRGGSSKGGTRGSARAKAGARTHLIRTGHRSAEILRVSGNSAPDKVIETITLEEALASN